MSAIDLLLNRNSYPKLQDPAPKGEQREKIFQAALRAPDHAMLKPWRFVVIEGDRRKTLGLDMADIMFASNPTATDAEMTKVQNTLRRAPLVIVAICKMIDHPKIPKIEQLLSTGCAIHQMLLAAEDLGFGGIWRTGVLAYHAGIAKLLGLQSDETIVGFLYLGTPAGERKVMHTLNTADFFKTK